MHRINTVIVNTKMSFLSGNSKQNYEVLGKYMYQPLRVRIFIWLVLDCISIFEDLQNNGAALPEIRRYLLYYLVTSNNFHVIFHSF